MGRDVHTIISLLRFRFCVWNVRRGGERASGGMFNGCLWGGLFIPSSCSCDFDSLLLEYGLFGDNDFLAFGRPVFFVWNVLRRGSGPGGVAVQWFFVGRVVHTIVFMVGGWSFWG